MEAMPPDPLIRGHENKMPSTTAEEDRTTFGQRRINLIWEVTQAIIAVTVTLVSLVVAGTIAIRGDGGQAAFLLLSNAFFLIIGFYFSRTNHTKTGGVGPTEGKNR